MRHSKILLFLGFILLALAGHCQTKILAEKWGYP